MSDYNLQQEVSDKYSLRGRVFHKIREDILNGKYKQNEELREATIGAELGVSRTPVREAFRQLELEGLLKMIPNKGTYVTGITRKDVHDIYMIRSLLEDYVPDGQRKRSHRSSLTKWRKMYICPSSMKARAIQIRWRSWTTGFMKFYMNPATVKCWSICSVIFTSMYTGSAA